MDAERFIHGLAAALPEAFVDCDLSDEFYDEFEQRWWGSYIALPRAREWIADHALRIDVHQEIAAVRPGREDPVRRFFDYVERAATDADRDMRNLLMIEVFEGVP